MPSPDPEAMPLQQMVSTAGEAAAAFASQALLDSLSRPGSWRIVGHGKNGGQILAASEAALAQAQWVLRQAYGSSLLFGMPTARATEAANPPNYTNPGETP